MALFFCSQILYKIIFLKALDILAQVCYTVVTVKKTTPKTQEVILMKILKRADQKNFIVSDVYYTKHELEDMAQRGIITYLFDAYRIYASDCTEVKVVCENGYYTTVVITKEGTKVFVEL